LTDDLLKHGADWVWFWTWILRVRQRDAASDLQATSFIFMTFSNPAQVNPLKRPAVLQMPSVSEATHGIRNSWFFPEIVPRSEIMKFFPIFSIERI
jgi:hypothetical protein